jgi:hypothetical protein
MLTGAASTLIDINLALDASEAIRAEAYIVRDLIDTLSAVDTRA